MGRIVFVTGGARSGKSAFAERAAIATGEPVVYLATMEALDDELVRRVERHRQERPAGWETVEAPIEVAGTLRRLDLRRCVLLDCLSLWVSNAVLAGIPDIERASVADWEGTVERVIASARDVIALQRERRGSLVVVTNEVGSGIVPGEPLSRWYRDALGLVNQSFARAADEAWLLVSGLPVRLK
jgi:adenosylcobinamide kinase/adenosylcobinamide-phosphate guanylyltransferase